MEKPSVDGSICGLYAMSVQRIGDPRGGTQQLCLALLPRSFFLIELFYTFIDAHVLPPSSAKDPGYFECGPLANPASHRGAAHPCCLRAQADGRRRSWTVPGGHSLDSGVPDAQVAAWAGHSLEMLRRVYAGRAEGLEGVWITRMDQTLPQEKP